MGRPRPALGRCATEKKTHTHTHGYTYQSFSVIIGYNGYTSCGITKLTTPESKLGYVPN